MGSVPASSAQSKRFEAGGSGRLSSKPVEFRDSGRFTGRPGVANNVSGGELVLEGA